MPQEKPLPKQPSVPSNGSRCHQTKLRDVADGKPKQPPTLASMFALFAKYRPTLNSFQGDGKRILLSQSDCWMQQADLIGSKFFTLTQTGLTFFEFRKSSLDYGEYMQFLTMLCTERQVDLEEVKEKLINCGPPGINT